MTNNIRPDFAAHRSSLAMSQVTALLAEAAIVARHAYAPYSRFKVGAALLLDNGEVVTGCNVENASYRLTTCAEQSAIAAAVSRFGPAIKLQAVAVANLNGVASQPCGACRQTILEFSTPGTWIFYPATDGSVADVSIEEMLPAGFVLAH